LSSLIFSRKYITEWIKYLAELASKELGYPYDRGKNKKGTGVNNCFAPLSELKSYGNAKLTVVAHCGTTCLTVNRLYDINCNN
jgi:hypothetical protein